ncbi:MAG: GDSL-type esterase/lipase family protein [Coriobacteriia bacterium]|nr:GDSL-type esterase/lipase family protein [Coriobacteriia bacterium]
MRGARATVALLVASLCVGTACTAPRQSGSTPDVVIVGFGDSIVYGSNYPKPWLYTLLERLTSVPITYVPEWPWDWDAPSTRHDRWYESGGVRVYNSGIDGNTTAQLLSRFEEDVAAVKPDSCLILGGTNDIFRGVPLSTIEANLTQLYDDCAEAGITPVACTLTPVKQGFLLGDSADADALNSSIDTLNAWIRTHCAERSIAVVDFNTVLKADPATYLQDDGIHPSEAGHDAMGRSVDLAVLGLAR